MPPNIKKQIDKKISFYQTKFTSLIFESFSSSTPRYLLAALLNIIKETFPSSLTSFGFFLTCNYRQQSSSMFISRNRRYNILIKPFASMDVEKVPGYQTRAPDIFRRSFEVQITRLEACGQLQPLNASAKNVHRHVEREKHGGF